MTRKSKRQQQIDSLTAQRYRPDAVALARIAPADIEPVYDLQGRVTQAKRRSNVFRVLREKNTLTPNESAAGVRLVELYARWKGLAGSAEDGRLMERIDGGRADSELVNDRMLKAGEKWREIMRFVGPSSARLLEALAADIVEGDGTPVMVDGRPQVRWRQVVTRVTGESHAGAQMVRLRAACADLAEYWR